MIRLGLSPEQQKILMQILEDYISDLRVEIGNTDNIVFKAQLRSRKEILGEIVENLRKARKSQASKGKQSRRKSSTRKRSPRG
jgi:hypothetical protein